MSTDRSASRENSIRIQTHVSVTVTRFLENQMGDYRTSLNLLLGAVGFVLSSRVRTWPICSRRAARRVPANSPSAPPWERRAGKSFVSS